MAPAAPKTRRPEILEPKPQGPAPGSPTPAAVPMAPGVRPNGRVWQRGLDGAAAATRQVLATRATPLVLRGSPHPAVQMFPSRSAPGRPAGASDATGQERSAAPAGERRA